MVIFVDGFQNVGKSTLIDNCKYRHNRFPFNQYMDMFELKDINGFQIGKDLGILFGLQYAKDTVVFDRGPFSTIFYSLKEKRYGDKTEEMMFKFMSELKNYQNARYVFVKKKNADPGFVRNHGDGFDYLDDERDEGKDALLDSILGAAKKAGLEVKVFENDFSIKIKRNIHKFNDLLEELSNEHN